MKLSTVLNKIQFNVGEVSEFLWKSLGDCRIWAFNNVNNEEIGTFVVNKVGDVLALECYHTKDNGKNICYRWVNEKYREEYLEEEIKNTINFDEDEKTNFVDLEEEDCLEKLEAIVNLEDFDCRSQVTINITDNDFTQIARMAHEADITFNQQVNLILAEFVDREKQKKEDAEASEKLVTNTYFPPTVLEVQEGEDGELFLQFTPEMLNHVGWQEGDTINFDECEDGSFVLTKVR